MSKIFISYRRDDSPHAAGRIYDRLAEKFGRESIFIDINSIPFGVDYRHYVINTIRCCSAFLLIIGDQWLSNKDCNDNMRLNNPSDFLRIEIESAIQLNIPITPILVGRYASMPKENQLPISLKDLIFRQAIEARPGAVFNAQIDYMVKELESVISDQQARSINYTSQLVVEFN